MSDTISNALLHERFERLAVGCGRNALAEHLGLRLGWQVDGNGRHQEPYQYRRGVLVQLGLMENRNQEVLDEIAAPRAARIHAELDRVEQGAPLEREQLVVAKPAHVSQARSIA
jgi:hypothetical protein